jgi:ATP-dependent Clp protease ATP-binding subunit ClpA
MFERYTERARRVIFFARYEASQFGSTTIEAEHFLLGLLREDKNVVTRFFPNSPEDIRQKVVAQITVGAKIATSIDLPLSNECKRILAYANEEAEGLKHRHIGTEHILLGMLRESGCVPAEILKELGLTLESVREQIAKLAPSSFTEPAPFAGFQSEARTSVHALVARFPEYLLGQLKSVIESVLNTAQHQHGEAGVLFLTQEERVSSSRHDESGDLVVETQQPLGRHRISINERFRLSDDGKKLHYYLEVVGPKPGQQHKHSVEFDLS